MTLLQRLAIQNHPKPFTTEKGWNKVKYSTWYSIRFELVKKTSMPNPVQSLRYIKFHSLSSLRLIKSPRNSMKCNWKKICSWSRRPKTILEMRKKAWLIEVISKSIVNRFLKDFTNLWKKSKRVLAIDLSLIYLNTGNTYETSKNLENKIPSDNYWRVRLVSINAQSHIPLEPSLEHNQDQTHLMNQGWSWPS